MFKLKLPGALISGRFFERNDKGIAERTPAICCDLDELENPEGVRELVIADPYVLACFISPTGTGLKVVFRINPANSHAECYRAAEHYVREHFGLEIDSACRNISRLCFVSDDPDAFLADTAEVLPDAPKLVEIPELHPHTQARVDFPKDFLSPGDDYDARGDWRSLLTANGWTKLDDHYWARPGRTRGISASWDMIPDHPGRFYVFSTSVTGFRVGPLYKPWHIFAVLEAGGDWKVASEKLYALGYGSRHKARAEDIDQETRARLDAKNEESRPMPGDRLLPEPPAVDSWPEPVGADALCLTPPPTPPELIAGILYAPGTMLISGPSKSRKTFTALDLGIAIATGSKWFGRQCHQSPVLAINLELQDFASTDRIARICAARGISPPANLRIWNLRGRTVNIAELIKRLPDMIAKTGAKCVIIDPHYKISSVSGMEESSNDDQGKLLSIMEGLCHNSNAALILTHHFAKGDASAKNAQDRASGAGTFTRWPDAFVTFTPHEEDDAMTVDFFLRNFAPVDSFVVRWEFPRWQTDAQLDPADLKTSRGPREKNTANDALSALGDDMLGFAEWQTKTGMSKTTFRRKREELLDTGKIEQIGMFYRKKTAEGP